MILISTLWNQKLMRCRSPLYALDLSLKSTWYRDALLDLHEGREGRICKRQLGEGAKSVDCGVYLWEDGEVVMFIAG